MKTQHNCVAPSARSLNLAKGLLVLAAVAAVARPAPVAAYDSYSVDRATGNCAECHGGFRVADYVSRNDGTPWNASLHDAHRTAMLGGDCDVCHGGNRFPVRLDSSIGGTGFDPISCLGCHGRAEPAAGGAVTGAGLRQHHYRTGVTLCGNSGCHTDANPAGFSVAGENVKPPYYFTPDPDHPDKPTDPCNAGGIESAVAPSLGLDNDGDNVYDQSDSNCGATGVPESPGAPAVFLANVAPNPVVERGLYHFSLSRRSRISLTVLDIQGRAVRTLLAGELDAGDREVEWDGNDDAGRPARSGIYFIRLAGDGLMAQRKFVFLR